MHTDTGTDPHREQPRPPDGQSGGQSGGIRPAAKRKRKRWDAEQTSLWLYLLPFVLYIFVFSYVPLFGWIIAFMNYIPGVPLFENSFDGLRWFRFIFSTSGEFSRILINTLALSFLGIAVSPIPFVLAILLYEVRQLKLRRVFQTLLSLPAFISYLVVFSIFFVFFSYEGYFNQALQTLGLIERPTNLLGNEALAWYTLTFADVWKGAGWGAIIYLGAIAGIDPVLYEASRIDGASRFHQALYITIPGILPTYAVLLILSVATMLSGSSFEMVLVFMNPLIQRKIETIDFFVFNVGIQQLNYSLATAVGIFKSVVSLSALFLCNEIGKKILGRSII